MHLHEVYDVRLLLKDVKQYTFSSLFISIFSIGSISVVGFIFYFPCLKINLKNCSYKMMRPHFHDCILQAVECYTSNVFISFTYRHTALCQNTGSRHEPCSLASRLPWTLLRKTCT